jgi:hypothetical protein
VAYLLLATVFDDYKRTDFLNLVQENTRALSYLLAAFFVDTGKPYVNNENTLLQACVDLVDNRMERGRLEKLLHDIYAPRPYVDISDDRFTSIPKHIEAIKEIPIELLRKKMQRNAAELFALIVFCCPEGDDNQAYLQSSPRTPANTTRFLKIATQLPLELQQTLSHRVFKQAKELVSKEDNRRAFEKVGRKLS